MAPPEEKAGPDAVIKAPAEPLNRKGEFQLMDNDARTNPVRLAALGATLAARLDVEMTERGLVVHNPQVAGCCEEQPTAGDTITVRRRYEDDPAWWFRTSWGEWIAPVDRLADATKAVLGYLGCCPETAKRSEAGR